MSSNHVEDFLTDYIDGVLTGPTLDRVKSHLVFCTDCRQLHQDIVKNISKLKQTPLIPPSPQLEKKILQALSEKSFQNSIQTQLSRPTWIQWFLSFRGMSLAGASLILIFVLQNASKMTHESKISIEKHDLPTINQIGSEDSAIKDKSSLEVKETLPSTEPSAYLKIMPKTVEARKTSPESAVPPSINALAGAAPTEALIIRDTKMIDNQDISGYSSGISQPLEKVISDQKTWQEYWNKHQKFQSPQAPLPSVDFEKNEVIAIFAGEQPTLGFRVEITRVILTQWENAPARVVRYRVVAPPTDAMVGQMITQPYCFKVVPKNPGPTFFKKIR